MARRRPPFGGNVFIADTSAWAHAGHHAVAGAWKAAMRGGQIAVTPITALELLYTRDDGDSFDLLAADLAQLRNVPITRSVTNGAQRAYRTLAHVQPRFHRSVKINDLLIAAAAEDAAVGVLHYDQDFDVLAGVLSFESRWIAPRGSL
jgi:predicted nucleic acid-binding protein